MNKIRKVKLKAVLSKFRTNKKRFINLGCDLVNVKRFNRITKKCIKLKFIAVK